MGNTQCFGNCDTCLCLNLTTFKGDNCTRLLHGEQSSILLFSGSVLFFVTLFVQLGFISYEQENSNLNSIVRAALAFISGKVTLPLIIGGLGLAMIASATVWSLIETLGTKCFVTATDTPESTWAVIGYAVLFGIVTLSLVVRILLDCWNDRNLICSF